MHVSAGTPCRGTEEGEGGAHADGEPCGNRPRGIRRRVRAAIDRGPPRAGRSPAVHDRRDRRACRSAAARLGAAGARRPAARQSGRATSTWARGRPRRRSATSSATGSGSRCATSSRTPVRRAHQRVPRRGGARSCRVARGACGVARATSSSPPAASNTPMHFDPEHSFLLQVRGVKHVSVAAFEDDSVRQRELDHYYDGEECDFAAMEEVAEHFRIDPGVGVYLPSFVPHWVRPRPASPCRSRSPSTPSSASGPSPSTGSTAGCARSACPPAGGTVGAG